MIVQKVRRLSPRDVRACLCQAEPNRVSRELDEAVWSVDFGMTQGKPQYLQRQHFVEREDCSGGGPVVEQTRRQQTIVVTGWPNKLQLLSGREMGVCYYSSKPLSSSPSANWLLTAQAGRELRSRRLSRRQWQEKKAEAYVRMPLLFTPVERFIPLGAEPVGKITPVQLNPNGKDRQARVP